MCVYVTKEKKGEGEEMEKRIEGELGDGLGRVDIEMSGNDVARCLGRRSGMDDKEAKRWEARRSSEHQPGGVG